MHKKSFGLAIKKQPKQIKAIIILLIIVALFFAFKWTFEGPFFKNDSAIITIPLENLYGNIQHSGQSPLWAPELAGGYPLLAIGQMGFWYPLHMILRQFFPGVVTLNISLLLHTILALLGTFFFLKHNKLGNIASMTAAILLPLSPVFVARYEMLNLVLPFTWLPLILLLIQLCVENPQRRNLASLMVANILLVLVGHPQMTAYVFIAEIIFLTTLLFFNWRRWPKIILIGIFIIIAVGLSVFSILPIVDNLPDTDRANGNNDNPYEFQLTPASLTGIFVAHPFGHNETYNGPKNEAELASYLGPFALLCSLVGLFTARKKFPTIYYCSIVFIIVGLAFGLGELSPFYRWTINHGWTYFSAPARFYFFIHIGLVFFTALGVEYCVSILKKWKPRYYRQLSFLLIGLIVFPALFFSYTWTKNIPWKHAIVPEILQFVNNRNFHTRLASIPNLSILTPNSKQNIDFVIKIWRPISNTSVFRQTFKSPFPQIDGIAITLSIPQFSTGKLALKLFGENGQIIRRSSIIAKKFRADDWNTFNFEPVKEAENKNFYFEITSDIPHDKAPLLYIHNNLYGQYDSTGELSSCLNNKCTVVTPKNETADINFKILAGKEKTLPGFETLAGHVASGYYLGSTFWIGALPIFNVKNFNIRFEKDVAENDDLWRLNRFSSDYLIGFSSPYRFVANENFPLINSVPFGEKFIYLLKNNNAFPRLSFVQKVSAVRGASNQLEATSKITPQDRDTVVADTNKDFTLDNSDAKAKFFKDDRTKIEIQTENKSDGFLVLRDVYLKGWYATIDGNPTTIYRTDSIFRGVFVPAGNHLVSFQYKPDWIKPAIVIEIISVMAFLGLIFFIGKHND